MQKKMVHINFEVMAKAFREFVRQKAIQADNTIVYVKDGLLIEENPKTSAKNVLNSNLLNVN
jgi:hypothetical protein